jgi:6-phosphogluconolactonase (cycloisomerase 2 family)
MSTSCCALTSHTDSIACLQAAKIDANADFMPMKMARKYLYVVNFNLVLASYCLDNSQAQP